MDAFWDKRDNFSEEEYKKRLCQAWEKWRQAIFAGKDPQQALKAAKDYLDNCQNKRFREE